MKLLAKILATPITIIFVFGSLWAGNKIEPKLLFTKDTVTVCDGKTEKTFVAYIDIGQIYSRDSLYSITFGIRYDEYKLQAVNYILTNTIFESCDFSNGSNISTDLYQCNLASFGSVPYSGGKALAAVAFKVLDTASCDGQALLKLEYLSFNSEYQNTVDSIENAKFILEMNQSDNSVKISKESDTIKFTENDTIKEFISKISFGKFVKSQILKFDCSDYDTSKIKIDSVSINSKNSYLIKYDDNKYYLQYSALDTLIEIKYKTRKIKNDDWISDIKETLTNNYCSCINDIKNDTIILQSKKTISSVKEEDCNNKIEKIEVYDLMGKRLFVGNEEEYNENKEKYKNVLKIVVLKKSENNKIEFIY